MVQGPQFMNNGSEGWSELITHPEVSRTAVTMLEDSVKATDKILRKREQYFVKGLGTSGTFIIGCVTTCKSLPLFGHLGGSVG